MNSFNGNFEGPNFGNRDVAVFTWCIKLLVVNFRQRWPNSIREVPDSNIRILFANIRTKISIRTK
jgi:hypothetical protein